MSEFRIERVKEENKELVSRVSKQDKRIDDLETVLGHALDYLSFSPARRDTTELNEFIALATKIVMEGRE